MTKSLTRKPHLKQKFIMLRMVEGAHVKGHIEEFNSIVLDLENVDIKIDDEDQSLQLLCSLTPTYKHLCETLLYGRESITLKGVKAVLLPKDIIWIKDSLVGIVKDKILRLLCQEGVLEKGAMMQEIKMG